MTIATPFLLHSTPLPVALYRERLLVPNISNKTKISKWPSVLPIAVSFKFDFLMQSNFDRSLETLGSNNGALYALSCMEVLHKGRKTLNGFVYSFKHPYCQCKGTLLAVRGSNRNLQTSEWA